MTRTVSRFIPQGPRSGPRTANAGVARAAASRRGVSPRSRPSKRRDAASTYQVLVHVDQAVLSEPAAEGRCEVEGAVGVPAGTSLRLSCDAPVLELPAAEHGCCGGGQAGGCRLDLGRSRRRASAALERAVRTRDDGVCQFPGCESRGFLQLHHIQHWADGGPASLENMTLLCHGHHRDVHEGGYSARRGEDGVLRFFTPMGAPLPPRPAPVSLPPQPVQALMAQHQDLTEPITAQTGRPTWDGIGRVDYGVAVAALLEHDASFAES